MGLAVCFTTSSERKRELKMSIKRTTKINNVFFFSFSGNRELDSLGGGNILREVDNRQLDEIGGGNILREIDSLGGGNILRSLKFPSYPIRQVT